VDKLVYGCKLINSIWNKEELPEEWKEPIILLTKQVVVIIETYHFVNYIQNYIQHPAVKIKSI